MRAFPGTGNGMAVRASGIQQLFSTPSQVRLLGVGKLRENGSGNRNERQVDGGTHASGSSLNEPHNRGGYSEKGVFCVLTPRSSIHFVSRRLLIECTPRDPAVTEIRAWSVTTHLLSQ